MTPLTDLRVSRKAHELFPGLLIAVIVALAAKFISEHYGAPVMLMALLFGMALNFLSDSEGPCVPGIEMASKTVLRFGVGLLGLGITVQQMLATGTAMLSITVSGVVLTICLGLLLSRALGRKTRFGLLTGGAVAICGASAALAIASVLPRNNDLERDTVFTVIAVTALSTVAMIAYPILAQSVGFDDVATGVFLGATIHDVAQVVGAGYSVSDTAGETATFVKLLRVAFLVPLVILLSVLFRTKEQQKAGGLPVPFFVLGFCAMVGVNSFDVLPAVVLHGLLDLARWCLVIAIAALGMKTSLGKLRDVGGKSIFLVCALTVLLAGFALVSIKLTMA